MRPTLRILILCAATATLFLVADSDQTEPKKFTRAAEHVTETSAQVWADLSAVSKLPELPRSTHFEIESISEQKATTEDRVAMGMKTTARSGKIAEEHRERFEDALRQGSYQLTKHTITFKDQRAAADTVRASTNPSPQIESLKSLQGLKRFGLALEAIGMLRQTKEEGELLWYSPDGRRLEPTDTPFPFQNVQEYLGPFPNVCLVFDRDNVAPDFLLHSLRFFDANTRDWVGTSLASPYNNTKAKPPALGDDKLVIISPLEMLHKSPIDVVLEFLEGPIQTKVVPVAPGPLYDSGEGAVVSLLLKGNIYRFGSTFDSGTWKTLIHEEGSQGAYHQFGLLMRTQPARVNGTFEIDALTADGTALTWKNLPGIQARGDREGNLIVHLSKEQVGRVESVRIRHRPVHRRLIFRLPTPWLTDDAPGGDLLDVVLPYARVGHHTHWPHLVGRFAQIEISAPIQWGHGDPRIDDYPLEMKNVSLRSIWERYAATAHTNKDITYDSDRCSISVVRRPVENLFAPVKDVPR